MAYIGNALIGLDMFASTLIPGGVPGDTLSGRAGSAYLQHKIRGYVFCPVIDVFMWLCRQYPTPRGHCVHACTVGDVARAKAVIASQGGRA